MRGTSCGIWWGWWPPGREVGAGLHANAIPGETGKVCGNLQTAWLSPPVALSAYFLKGVVPQWELGDIYAGMMQFMGLQLLGLVLIILFPDIALWLPRLIYGG